jgi:dolichol kinase
MFLAFPAQPEMGLVVTVIIAFGDGSATLGGMLVQGPSLPWNNDKSWVGFSAFLLISIPLAAVVYWGEARPGVSLSTALACVAPACLAAGVAESLPMRLNDNIRVGMTASLTIIVTQNAFV